jgi:methyl coenzyme M reductase subunit C-like uncharacterized protein (methanogenesis marker protein 7)
MKNETNKRAQRTPAEIIAETEAKLERLRMKETKQAAQSHPALASLIVEKTDVQKEIREAKKILGAGPQSADARMAKHYAWISKIEEQKENAYAILQEAESRLTDLDNQISVKIATLVQPKRNGSRGLTSTGECAIILPHK